jgi:hypothetical protein
MATHMTDDANDMLRSFEEAVVPLLELIERLSPDGQIKVVDIQVDEQSGTATAILRVPVTWSPTPPPASD